MAKLNEETEEKNRLDDSKPSCEIDTWSRHLAIYYAAIDPMALIIQSGY